MREVIVGAIIVLMQVVSTAHGQQTDQTPRDAALPSKPAVQLILSPNESTVTSDGDFMLNVTVINQTQKKMWCLSATDTSGVDDLYIYDIRMSDGKPVPRVRRIGDPNPAGPPCSVFPGGSFNAELPGLMHAFDMSRPGVYRVGVSLPDPDYPGRILGRSNIVIVTVKAPK